MNNNHRAPRRANPINASVQPLQGQKLPSDWRQLAPGMGRQANEDYLARLQNAWKQPMGNHGIVQQARLQNPRQDSEQAAHNQQSKSRNDGHNVRLDGQMELVEERADGWQIWRDKTSGSTVWRRLQWSDVIGQK